MNNTAALDPKLKASLCEEAKTYVDIFQKQLKFNFQVVLQQDGCVVKCCEAEDSKLPPIWYLEGICEAPLEVLAELCLMPENRLKWDTSTMESRRLATLSESPFIDIVYYSTKPIGGGVISSREFVDLRYEYREEGRIIQAGGSIDYPSLATSKGLVRGWDYPCGFMIEKVDANRSKLVGTTQHDLKGWLPTALVRNGTAAHLMQLAKDFKNASAVLAKQKSSLETAQLAS